MILIFKMIQKLCLLLSEALKHYSKDLIRIHLVLDLNVIFFDAHLFEVSNIN